MEKFSREIDEKRMGISKVHTIDNVMERIKNEKTIWSFFKPVKFKLILTVFSLVLLIVVVIAINPRTPIEPITLSEVKTKKLVETSYMSASIISNALANTQTTTISFIPLVEIETEFEKNIDEFNYYFNMLKVFIDDDAFVNNAIVESLTNSDFEYKISYLVQNKEHIFYLTIDKNGIISGEIIIGSQVFVVEGNIEEDNDEFELELIARKNNDYIEIEYSSEFDDEIQKTYYIKQFINGVLTEKEITVEIEDDEVKVEIKQGNDNYLLEKYSENGVTVYFLEYEVNGREGEVYITEEIDAFGKTIYRYHISEGDLEKDLDLEDPGDEDDEDDDENEDDDDDEDLYINYFEDIKEL